MLVSVDRVFRLLLCLLVLSICPVYAIEIDQSSTNYNNDNIDSYSIELFDGVDGNVPNTLFKTKDVSGDDYTLANNMNPSSNVTNSLKNIFVDPWKKYFKICMGIVIIIVSIAAFIYGCICDYRVEAKRADCSRVESKLTPNQKERFDQIIRNVGEARLNREDLFAEADHLNRINEELILKYGTDDPTIYADTHTVQELDYFNNDWTDLRMRQSTNVRRQLSSVNPQYNGLQDSEEKKYMMYSWLKVEYPRLHNTNLLMQLGSGLGIFTSSGLISYSWFFENE